jgi:hypothetical protein
VRITSSWTCEEAEVRDSRQQAQGFDSDAAQVVGGVGKDRAAHVSDEMWALSPEPTGQSAHQRVLKQIVG